MMYQKTLTLPLILFLMVVVFNACGGGGGGDDGGVSGPAPKVTTATPVTGTTEVALNTQVKAIFDIDMDSSSINTDTFILLSPSGINVSGTVSYDAATKTATFAPSVNLAPLTTYTATITGAKSKDGVLMDSLYSWGFTTITGFWAYDFVSNSDYLISATKVGEGSSCVIYLEQGQSFVPDIINSIVGQFDNSIYPNEISTFGSEPNPGIDGNTKIFILLLDIKDGYTPASGYISGYFDPLNEHDISKSPHSNQKEMFYMDTNPETPGGSRFNRTLAHEFQHLISWHQKSNLLGVYEDTWLDEAMSEIAPVFCGYGPDYEEVFGYELMPWDSLVGWDDEVYDYYTVYMWAQYIKDRVTNSDSDGHGVFWDIEHTENVGIRAVNSALTAVGYGKDFKDIFRDWSIANYFGLTTVLGHPEWSYTSIHTEAGCSTDFGFLPGLPVNNPAHINATTVGGLHMWGLDYFKFTKTGQGTVTWTETNDTDEAAFIDTSNNTVIFSMTSGIPYPFTGTGILIARNPTNTEKWWTINPDGGGTMTRTSIVAGGETSAPYLSKSYNINLEPAKESVEKVTPKTILLRIASDPVAKAVSSRTGRPISICVYHFFKEREKALRQELLKK
jgi:hypothetical protein